MSISCSVHAGLRGIGFTLECMKVSCEHRWGTLLKNPQQSGAERLYGTAPEKLFGGAELLEQGVDVKHVPMLGQLTILHAKDVHGLELVGFPGGWNAQPVTLVCS